MRPPVQKIARDAARKRELSARGRRAARARDAQHQRALAVRSRLAADTRRLDSGARASTPVPPPAPPALRSRAESVDPYERLGPRRRRTALVLSGVLVLVAVGFGAWTALRSAEPAASSGPAFGSNLEEFMSSPVPEHGTHVNADVRPDGTVRTELSLIAGEDPIRELLLALPAAADGLAPVVSGLRVRADGLVVPGAPSSLAVGETTTVQLAEGVHTAQLAFRTTGVVDRAAGSGTGRALVLVNALDVRTTTAEPGASQATENVVVVASEGLLALACADPDQIPLRPCGVPGGGAWTVTTPFGQPAVPVIAQVDLQDA